MHLKTILLGLTILFSVNLFSQLDHSCLNEQIQLKENKERQTVHNSHEFSKSISPKFINTVVHVVYSDDNDFIPVDSIEALIEDLNRLFRAEGIDTSFVYPVHRDKLMDSQIQFCLAKTDPDGMSTTGITYTKTDVVGFPSPLFGGSEFIEEVKFDSLGGKSAWNIDEYLNIWIAPMGEDYSNSNYAIPREEYFPLNAYVADSRIPGALIDMYNFRNPTLLYKPVENLLAHECGHALGLMHTFHSDDFSSEGQCKGSDFVGDTPTAKLTSICDPSIIENTCVDSLFDEPDHITNFMNYACNLMFTPDQITIMHNNLALAPTTLFDNSVCNTVSSVLDNEIENILDFTIFPNPNEGNFVVQFNQTHFSNPTFSLYNSMGQIIFEKSYSFKKQIDFQVNRNELEKGIYYLNVRSDNGYLSKKLVVH